MNSARTKRLSEVMTLLEDDALLYYAGMNLNGTAECYTTDIDDGKVHIGIDHMEVGGYATHEDYTVYLRDLDEKTAKQIFLDLK